MSLPALILCLEPGSELMIGGITVLDRLLVTLHRAGCAPITVVTSGPLPAIKRARALAIPFVQAEATAAGAQIHGDFLCAHSNLLVMLAEVREVLRLGGRLLAGDATPLPLGIVRSGNPSPFTPPADAPVVHAGPVSCQVRTPANARAASSRFWTSLTSSSDGTVDRYFNRPVGRPLSRLLVQTPITPNQVSLASTLIGVISAWFFSRGARWEAVTGAVLLQVSAIIDCVDGDVARMALKESAMGKWLDLVGDQVVHVALFVGIALGLAEVGSAAPVSLLATSAIVGALLSFLVVLRGLIGNGAKQNSRLQGLIDAATNRDFSVLVIILAIFGGLEWFLWLAAIGSHAFWITALFLQTRSGEVAKRPVSGSR